MMISHTHRFIFIHIYKTGGSSLLKALEPYGVSQGLPHHPLAREVREIIEKGESENYRYWNGLQILTDKPSAWKDYFKFAFVRNPYDYAVSLYCWLAINTSHDMYSYINSITFLEFLKTLKNPELEPSGFQDGSARVFRRPLSDFVLDEDGNELLDFVGKWENLEREYSRICDKLFIPQRPSLPPTNISPRDRDYRVYYDEEGKAIIEEVFKKDLEYFGYEF